MLKRIILGSDTNKDFKYWTEVKVYIKPPNTRFPTTALFLNVTNAKASVFVRLSSTTELTALATAFTTWVPELQSKIDELAPMEAQYKAAAAAYEAALNSNGGSNG